METCPEWESGLPFPMLSLSRWDWATELSTPEGSLAKLPLAAAKLPLAAAEGMAEGVEARGCRSEWGRGPLAAAQLVAVASPPRTWLLPESTLDCTHAQSRLVIMAPSQPPRLCGAL